MIDRPRLSLAVALAMTIASIALIFTRLKPETSFAGMLDRRDPTVIAMARVLEQFPVGNESLVLVSLPDAAGDSNQLTAFAERLTDRLAADRRVTHVRFRADARTRAFVEQVIVPNGLLYLDDAQLTELKQRLTRDGMIEQLERNRAMLAQPGPAAGGLAKTLAKDPLRLFEFLTARLQAISIPGAGSSAIDETGGAFLSPDRRSLLIRIGASQSPNDFNFSRELTDLITRATSEVNRDNLHVDLTGAYAITAHSAERIRADCISDVLTTVVGLALLFMIACRRPVRLFTFAFLPVAAGILWGFGAYAIVRPSITPLAAVVGGTLGAIGLDYTIHFIAHFQEVLAGAASSKDAVLRTRRELLRPSLAAWLTSVIGFAACAISPIQTLRDFAILGTLCLAGAWAATLFVLPAMLMLWPRASFAIRFETAGAIGGWIARHARGILICSTIVIAVMIVVLIKPGIRIHLDSDPMAMHPQPSAPLDAQRRIARTMQSAGGSLLVHLHAKSPTELLSLAHDVQSRLTRDEVRRAGIINTFGLGSLLPNAQTDAKTQAAIDADRVEHDLRAALDATGFRADAYDPYIAFLRKLAAPDPPRDPSMLKKYGEFGQLLLPRETLERDEPARESVVLLFTDAPLESRETRERALLAVRDAVSDLPGVTVTGTAAIGHDLERAIHRDLPRFVGVSLICIAGYLLVHFRSILLAGMALLPIAISLLAVIACISVFEIRLTLLHTVMAPLLLGINLDYGIFATYAWRRSRNESELGEQFPAALSALIICGGSTTIGFGSLVITSIPAVRSLGWLVNIGVGSCVLATLFVLWPIIMRTRRGGGAGETVAPTAPRETTAGG